MLLLAFHLIRLLLDVVLAVAVDGVVGEAAGRVHPLLLLLNYIMDEDDSNPSVSGRRAMMPDQNVNRAPSCSSCSIFLSFIIFFHLHEFFILLTCSPLFPFSYHQPLSICKPPLPLSLAIFSFLCLHCQFHMLLSSSFVHALPTSAPLNSPLERRYTNFCNE